MPLLITDDSGNLLYKSRAFGLDAAAFAAFIAKEELGLVQSGKLRMYVREVTLGGKRYRFYLDFDRLTECYGVSAARTAADGLFDMEALASAPKVSVTLKTLAHWFAESYGENLRGAGIWLEVHRMARPESVDVSPNAALLCIALAVRLCACRGDTVRLSAVRDGGRITLYADTDLTKKAETPGILLPLLYETASAVGMSVAEEERGGRYICSICLAPPDIGMHGFKVPLSPNYKKNAAFFAECFS